MYYQIYQDQHARWRWRLFGADHRVLADSGQAYGTKSACMQAIVQVSNSSCCPIRDDEACAVVR